MSSTNEALKCIVQFLHAQEKPTEWHPILFTYSGHRAGTPHAIRKLKKAGLIEIAAYNYDNRPLYKKTDKFTADTTWEQVAFAA